jgi:hypothetical protein
MARCRFSANPGEQIRLGRYVTRYRNIPLKPLVPSVASRERTRTLYLDTNKKKKSGGDYETPEEKPVRGSTARHAYCPAADPRGSQSRLADLRQVEHRIQSQSRSRVQPASRNYIGCQHSVGRGRRRQKFQPEQYPHRVLLLTLTLTTELNSFTMPVGNTTRSFFVVLGYK